MFISVSLALGASAVRFVGVSGVRRGSICWIRESDAPSYKSRRRRASTVLWAASRSEGSDQRMPPSRHRARNVRAGGRKAERRSVGGFRIRIRCVGFRHRRDVKPFGLSSTRSAMQCRPAHIPAAWLGVPLARSGLPCGRVSRLVWLRCRRGLHRFHRREIQRSGRVPMQVQRAEALVAVAEREREDSDESGVKRTRSEGREACTRHVGPRR